jgi:predicted Zn-dependent peptidase
MATTQPTQEELTMAERYLVGNTAITLQSQAALAAELASLWVDDLPPQRLGEESQQILNAKAQDVTAVSRKYYPASRTTIVAVGDPKVVKQQLREFGIPIREVTLQDHPAASQPASQ